ncbi:MAG: PEP/pyruvate-binding domain-containing protein, partial [Nitrospirae bacterium]|nr:PEP/pyruvate-binding domain-containing protein [Nitrospirota bacterium]
MCPLFYETSLSFRRHPPACRKRSRWQGAFPRDTVSGGAPRPERLRADFLAADEAGLREACQRLKQISSGYELNPEQKKRLREALFAFEEKTLFAVRSSSPEEDLEGASFAGCYETVLGVSPDRLEAALHTTFASCLDARIVAYKHERRIDHLAPRIAVVVQEQVASEVSGVGFSAHPHTGDPNQAVFESNWGLGETVVAGRVTPDHFVMNKPTRVILERRVGRKERAS